MAENTKNTIGLTESLPKNVTWREALKLNVSAPFWMHLFIYGAWVVVGFLAAKL